MKKYIAVTLSTMLFMSSAIAGQQRFYSVDVRPGPFFVYGVTANKENNENPTCYAEITWRDGSRFQLIRDLADGELYIYFKNNTWNISDAPGVFQLRANFEGNNTVSGLNFQYELLNKNTIVIRNIRKDHFLPLFSGSNKMTLVMPGSIQNAEVSLTGSSKSLAEISKCIEASSSINLYPDGPNNTNQNNQRNYDRI